MTDEPQSGDGIRLPRFADAEDPMAVIAADPSKQARYDRLSKSAAKAYIYWALLGFAGAHRYYLGYVVSGIFQLLLTGFGVVLTLVTPVGYFVLVAPGLWLAVDAAIIPAIVRHQNAELIEQILRRRG